MHQPHSSHMPRILYSHERSRGNVARYICRRFLLNRNFVRLESFSGEVLLNVVMLCALVDFWIFGERHLFATVKCRLFSLLTGCIGVLAEALAVTPRLPVGGGHNGGNRCVKCRLLSAEGLRVLSHDSFCTIPRVVTELYPASFQNRDQYRYRCSPCGGGGLTIWRSVRGMGYLVPLPGLLVLCISYPLQL
jgi:hypothetical protein